MPESAERATARALRSSARIALWASLALTLLAALVLSRLARPNPFATEMAAIGSDLSLWQGIDFETLPEVRTLQDYVRIDTAHPDPDELAGAEFLAARLATLGVPATIERMGERRANLWAFVEGEERAALVLHSHIDVEPAAAQEGWLYPPFGGVVDGPWIYGRGMYDMKSLAVAQLAAVEAVVRSGRKPRRSLLLLATSSEEAGSDTGTRWILARHPELVERMAVVLTEGGVVESLGPSEIKYWGIEFAQKHFGRVEYCGSDRERLEALAVAIRDGGRSAPRVEIDPAIRTFLAAYTGTRGLERYNALLAQPETLVADPRRFAELSPFMRSLFLDEVVPAPVAEEADGSFRLLVAIHLLPGSRLGPVVAELLPDWASFGVTATAPSETAAWAASPVDHPVYRALEAAVRAAHPGAPVGPYFLPWTATDSRYFRAAGIPSYGFSPFQIPVTDTLQIGQPNERMQLPGFVGGVRLYRDLVLRLVE
jgi:acetylornithine deacetylase/succinyl-diaminopimelate desuccinylase-like protein